MFFSRMFGLCTLLLALERVSSEADPQVFYGRQGFVKLPKKFQQFRSSANIPSNYGSQGNEVFYNGIASNFGGESAGSYIVQPQQQTIYNYANQRQSNYLPPPSIQQPMLSNSAYFPMPAASPCSSPPPLGGNCPVPWISPQQGFTYNPVSSNCQPVVYSGCGYNGNNYYNSYDSCMGICNIQQQQQPMYNYQPEEPCNTGCLPDQEQEDVFYCNQGLALSQSMVCNGYADCPSGEDEQNCQNQNYQEFSPITSMDNALNYQPSPSFSNVNDLTNYQPTFPTVTVSDAVDYQPNNYHSSSAVISLCDSNFNQSISVNPRIIVKFFTSTCAVCMAFAPEYERAARDIKLLGITVTFAKADLQSCPGLNKRFNIKTYPRILLWDNSRSPSSPTVKRYFKKFGLTAPRLSQWVRTQVRIPLPPGPSCSLNEHTCDTGGCVAADLVCDGSQQCTDGTDEMYCSRSSSIPTKQPEVVRPTNQPHDNVERVWVEDVPMDATEKWTPTRTTTTPRTRTTTTLRMRTTTTPRTRTTTKATSPGACDFRCNDGSCQSFAKRCDGISDCSDGVDEMNCPTTKCSREQFQCATDGNCIDNSLKCNGINDCQDGSDEQECLVIIESCDPSIEWQCKDQRRCIDLRRRCDGYPDCADLSDEDEGYCPQVPCYASWQFQCSDKKRCIDKRRQCDGYSDCNDSSDEVNCLKFQCDYWQLKCESNGICIDSRRRCDGTNDCLDATDEKNCDDTNPEMQTQEPVLTATTAAITTASAARTKTTPDGDFWGDIFETPATSTTSTATTRPTTTTDGGYWSDLFETTANVPTTRTTTTRPTTTTTNTTATTPTTTTKTTTTDGDYFGDLFETTTTSTTSTTRTKTTDGGFWGDLFETTVNASTTTPSLPTGCPAVCPFNYEPVCGSDGKTYSNECLLKSAACQAIRGDQPTLTVAYAGVCDGASPPPGFFPDTKESESGVNGCAAEQWACMNDQCISKTALCDSVKDCQGGEDELVCEETQRIKDEPVNVCDELDDFTCKSGSCIPFDQACDGIPQCSDGSDELDCTTPAQTGSKTTEAVFEYESDEDVEAVSPDLQVPEAGASSDGNESEVTPKEEESADYEDLREEEEDEDYWGTK